MPVLRPKVFGLGLSRTGTVSLGDALNILGIKTIHFPSDQRTFDNLRSGHYDLDILAEFQGIVDIPVAPFYPQLDAQFPGSKFILTVRDKESWLRSCEAFLPMIRDLTRADQQFTAFVHFIHACVYGVVPFNRERFSYVYDVHTRNVHEYFAGRPDDLLVMDITSGDGWERLCPFLGVDAPDRPFPHANVATGLVGVSDWVDVVGQATNDILAATPDGATFILVDDGMLGAEWDGGRHPIPLSEQDGESVGGPHTACTGDLAVEQLLDGSARFIVIAKWVVGWPDEYADLQRRLRSRFPCALDNARLVMFDLRTER